MSLWGGSCVLPTMYQTSIHTGYVGWTHLISLVTVNRERRYHIISVHTLCESMGWFLCTSNNVSNIHSYWLRWVNTSDITSTYKQTGDIISVHTQCESIFFFLSFSFFLKFFKKFLRLLLQSTPTSYASQTKCPWCLECTWEYEVHVEYGERVKK